MLHQKLPLCPPKSCIEGWDLVQTAGLLKIGASKAVAKAVTHAGSGSVSSSSAMKAIAAGHQKDQSTAKAGMLKLKTGMKRPTDVEPSSR
jgi:hypothetical protein